MLLIIDSKELRNIFDRVGDCPDHIGLQIPDPLACVEGGRCGECWEKALLQARLISSQTPQKAAV